MMYQGMKLADYLAMTGTKMEDVRKDYHESAERSVRTQLVVEAVMKAEDIKASDEQVEEELTKNAERAKKDIEEYRKTIDADELEYIRDSVAYDNTVRFLVGNAELKPESKKAEKKATEKKPAKKVKKDAPEKENTEGE
jgi:trigger factor